MDKRWKFTIDCPTLVEVKQKYPQHLINDDEPMNILHRFNHRRQYQHYSHARLCNDVITMGIFHRLHIYSKVHEKHSIHVNKSIQITKETCISTVPPLIIYSIQQKTLYVIMKPPKKKLSLNYWKSTPTTGIKAPTNTKVKTRTFQPPVKSPRHNESQYNLTSIHIPSCW